MKIGNYIIRKIFTSSNRRIKKNFSDKTCIHNTTVQCEILLYSKEFHIVPRINLKYLYHKCREINSRKTVFENGVVSYLFVVYYVPRKELEIFWPYPLSYHSSRISSHAKIETYLFQRCQETDSKNMMHLTGGREYSNTSFSLGRLGNLSSK